MHLAFLHISDIHLRDGRRNPAIQWIDGVAAAVAPEVAEAAGLFILVTGDAAFSGKAEEYKLAARALRDLKDRLSERGAKVIDDPGRAGKPRL